MTSWERLRQKCFHQIGFSIDNSESGPQVLQYCDIAAHLPVLEYYASKSKTVVEFGVRTAVSTVALLSGCRGQVDSWDLSDFQEEVKWLQEMQNAGELPCRWVFHKGSSIEPTLDIGLPDLIFFDTVHTSEHLGKELALHGHKAQKFLAFHDTSSCWNTDLSNPSCHDVGIGPAILAFLENQNRVGVLWEEVYSSDWSNGLKVFKRSIR